ncbi:MAG: EscS/YscS/HrcS family type III secretion system export apparatus protein [Planctomycetota bacterium]|nr:MAG: EscS/YscS/HrcS family type III secretion system export apparatus protein [Planctomycetota bacterium]
MSPETVLELFRVALIAALTLAAPVLGVALLVGLTVSIAQTITGVQEQTLSFVPKFLAVGAVGYFLLPWYLDVATGFATRLIQWAAQLAAG